MPSVRAVSRSIGHAIATLAVAWTAIGVADAAPRQRRLFFDDFAYARHDELTRGGWRVRTAAGWPGVPRAAWGPAGVSFHRAEGRNNRVLRMTAVTDGTAANTRQVQICHQRKYREGTYAARVRFTDGPSTGSGTDQTVQTFYTITPLREPMAPEYSEIDFEYLPNGGWGRTGPTLFATTWETFHPEPEWRADNTHEAISGTRAGWHTLVIQVAGGTVRYFLDGAPFAEHGGHVYPESPMSINFNLWFIRDGLGPAGAPRQYEQEIDWVFHEQDAVLTPGQVVAAVAGFRKRAIAFRDTVPQLVPPLDSPCNL